MVETTKAHIDYADCVAKRGFKQNPSDSYEDLVGDARLGLCQAAQRYDGKTGRFEGYAYLRIYGACIDGMRKRTNVHGRGRKKRAVFETTDNYILCASPPHEHSILNQQVDACLI
jgi:DNA-directed RNA polymerase specialized sigma subunit|tara:strand:+ start:966 stop:1310 length:345 start_codon:yes stop_codon:yes gene_type:complete